MRTSWAQLLSMTDKSKHDNVKASSNLVGESVYVYVYVKIDGKVSKKRLFVTDECNTNDTWGRSTNKRREKKRAVSPSTTHIRLYIFLYFYILGEGGEIEGNMRKI